MRQNEQICVLATGCCGCILFVFIIAEAIAGDESEVTFYNMTLNTTTMTNTSTNASNTTSFEDWSGTMTSSGIGIGIFLFSTFCCCICGAGFVTAQNGNYNGVEDKDITFCETKDTFSKVKVSAATLMSPHADLGAI